MVSKIYAVIFDIDGTLADCEHRRHYVANRPKNFKAFYDAMGDDKPNTPIVTILRAFLNLGFAGILCSGRPDDYRPQTEAWLRRWSISYDRLYMRKAGDFRQDFIVKKELLDRIKADGYEPYLAVDDRDQVVRMWRENGIPCLQCADGDF